MGRHTAPRQAALLSGVCGTLPDLDVSIDPGDSIRNMTVHRAESHAPLWLSVVSGPIALLIAAVQREMPQWRRWWLAVWGALVTHPLLDLMTVYGTQIAQPFTADRLGDVLTVRSLRTARQPSTPCASRLSFGQR